MTLHLAVNNADCVIHVSDRKLTVACDVTNKRNSLQNSVFDDNANKVVLAFTNLARVTIGYSGLAWIEDRPTDQWIVEKMIAEDFGPFRPWSENEFRGDNAASRLTFGKPRGTPMGRMLSNIRDAIRDLLKSGHPNPFELSGLNIFASGYEIVRSECRNKSAFQKLNWSLRQRTGSSDPVIGPARFYKRLRNRQLLMQNPPLLRKSDLNELQRQLRHAAESDGPCGNQNRTQILVDAVRRISAERRTVGPDVMCVYLPSPRCTEMSEPRSRRQREIGPVRIFSPAEVSFRSELADGPSAGLRRGAGYTPWIVHEHGYYRPMKIDGNFGATTLGVGSMGIKLTGGQSSAKNFQSVQSQQQNYWNP